MFHLIGTDYEPFDVFTDDDTDGYACPVDADAIATQPLYRAVLAQVDARVLAGLARTLDTPFRGVQ